MKTLRLRTILTAAIAMALASCHTTRQASQPSDSTTEILGSESEARTELRSLISSYDSWERLRIPVTVRLCSPKTASVSGTAIFERGKSILISLKYLGFEVGYIYATNDSVTVVDKINKRYAAENIRRFLGDFPLSITDLQDILTGRLFIPGQPVIEPDMFSKADISVMSGDSWTLIPADQPRNAEYGFIFQPANAMKGIIIRSGTHQPVDITYSRPVATPQGPIAPDLSVRYNTGKTILDATIEWNQDKARWNSSVELRHPALPSKYRRITASEIILMLSKL